MIKIRFLYYGTRKDGKLMDDLIGRTTHAANKKRMIADGFDPSTVPKLAHGEVELPIFDGMVTSLCYTSTMGQMRDRGILGNLFKKGDGTICRPISEVLTHPERWYYIDVMVSDVVFAMVESYLKLEVANNAGYDFCCILSFLCGVRFHSSKKNICSEVQHRVAILIGKNMPNDLRLGCYARQYANIWNDVPSPILQMLNMVSCGYTLRRCIDGSIVLGECYEDDVTT